jgi:hypothetical protein
MPSLGTIGGHRGAPGPTRKRALAHQAKTDLVADTPQQYQEPRAAKKFHTRRVGTTGEQLDKKNGLHVAVTSDVASILSILYRADIVSYLENPLESNSGKVPIMQDKCMPEACDAPELRLIFQPVSPDIEKLFVNGPANRKALLDTLDRFTAFLSSEDYFRLWDQVVKDISDLPSEAQRPVAEFYSMLRGSRDVARTFQRLRSYAYEDDPSSFKEELAQASARQLGMIFNVVCYGDAALDALARATTSEDAIGLSIDDRKELKKRAYQAAYRSAVLVKLP